MNKELIKFIELCLVDGIVTEKEREVIFRKSKELGVPEDECEIILDGLIKKFNGNMEQKSNNEGSLELNESYIDEIDVEVWIKNIDEVGRTIDSFLKNEKENMIEWFQNDFKNFLNNFEYSINHSTLVELMNSPRRGLWGDNSPIERTHNSKIKSILSKEEFWGFFKYSPTLQDRERILEYIEIQKKGSNDSVETNNRWNYEWLTFLWTNKGLHVFSKEKQIRNHTNEKIDKDFYNYQEIIDYNLNSTNWRILSKFKQMLELKYFTYEKLDLSHLFKTLTIQLNDSLFLEKCKEFNGDEVKLEKCLRINTFITRTIEEYNNSLINYRFKFLYTIESYLNNQGSYIDIEDRFDIVNEILNNHEKTLLFILLMVKYRDEYLNSILSKNLVNEKRILSIIEDKGILDSHFERKMIEKQDELIKQLSQINQTLGNINSSLESGLQSISSEISITNEVLGNINESITFNNLLTSIQTYQVYKINKNTK